MTKRKSHKKGENICNTWNLYLELSERFSTKKESIKDKSIENCQDIKKHIHKTF